MEAATTHASSARVRLRRAPRRRRIALGACLAVAAVTALGINFAGAKDPSLKDKINAAQSDAGQLSDRVDAQTAQIGSLTEQAHQAGAHAMELNAQVQDAEARSQELATQLDAAERQLDQLRGQFGVAVKELDQRLIAIYESDAPDYVTVLLNSDGFDDLSTRSDYLNALHDADRRIADKVASLRDQVADNVTQVADLKQQSDQEADQLTAAKASFQASEQAASQSAAAVAAARNGTQASLSDAQDQVAQLEQQQAEQQSSSSSSGSGSSTGSPAYLGGPYSIPTYIVMCESGGNYHALNSSSGAGGAYQILPSTWAAYGGEGEPQNAPKAEQDRIAAEIWADSGPSAWSCA
jgi:septal ring factor EnvC (AmiA/AmiB activator)